MFIENFRLLSHPKVWLPEEYKKLQKAEKTLGESTSDLCLDFLSPDVSRRDCSNGFVCRSVHHNLVSATPPTVFKGF